MKTSKACLAIWNANPWPIGLFFLANFVAFTIAPVILGYQMQWFFDAIGGEDPRLSAAVYLVIWMVVLAVVRGVVMMVRTVFYVLSNYVVSTMLRRNVFKNILERRGARSLGNSTGDAISRLRDDVDSITSFIGNVGYFGSFFLFCLIGLAIMWFVDQAVTCLVIVPFIVICIIITFVKPKIQSLTAKQRDTTANVTGFIDSTFSNIESIKAACAEKEVVYEFRRRNQSRRKAITRHEVFGSLMTYLGESMYFIGMAVFLGVVATRMRDGAFSVGEFALFAHFISYLGAGMHGLTKILVDYKGLAINIERLEEMLTESHDCSWVEGFSPGYSRESVERGRMPVKAVNQDSFEAFEICGLTYNYPQSGDGIYDVGFEIRAGECVVLAGEVGSGKTTLLRCMLGHLPTDRGKVIWDGKRVDDPAGFFIPDRCAYTPQRPQLFSDTLRTNIFQERPLGRSEITRVLEKSLLLNELDRLDEGLDTQVGPNGVKLSGGQVQRVALARMFANHSNLMVADDPVRGLDVETEKSFWDRLKIGENEAFLFASNSRLAMERADRILILKQGRIVGSGSLAELLDKNLEMRKLWML